MFNTLPATEKLPYALYRAAQVRNLDRCVIEEHSISGATLMERAGAAAWYWAKRYWPNARDITVLCGIGNNGGDGYVLARLALEEGYTVQVLQLSNAERLAGDALTMAQRYNAAGGEVQTYETLPKRTDLLVDGIFGTGLEREVTGDWAAAINALNQHHAPVLAIDIPSGLDADTGHILGCAVQAKLTVSFIALKQGLFTGQGPDCCGDVRFAGLEIPAIVYRREIISARRMDWQRHMSMLSPRPRCSHKGDFGHVLLVGGAPGMNGALRLAGEAAARCGAGLVTLATQPGQAALLNIACPELMCYELDEPAAINRLLKRATVIAIGPGMGQSLWSRGLLNHLIEVPQPLIIDADALNILATAPMHRDNWILTPHPGEAARLLGWTTAQVQQDRFTALHTLQERYGGTIVLKGAGTLIGSGSHRPPAVCNDGNPGMASGGMGDVLTGVIASLVAQGWELEDAACMGVCLHAAAGDAAAEDGERGLLASDLFPHLRRLLNPEFF